MIDALDISSSATVAQRIRLDTIAGNLANAEATRQEDGTLEPFRRRFVRFMTGDGKGGPGVHVDGVHEDQSAFMLVPDADHPDAGPDGYVRMPNVSPTMEFADAVVANRAYEANVAMMDVSRRMIRESVRLFA